MEDFYNIIGSDQDTLEWWQMAIRAFIVFIITMLFIRFGSTRMFGKNSAFDIVIVIVLGSILSRAVTGNSPFLPTITAAFVLIFLHVLLGTLALGDNKLGWLIKGKENCLIKDGEILEKEMKKCQITKNDLMEAVRMKGQNNLESVLHAYLERSGEISIIFKEEEDS